MKVFAVVTLILSLWLNSGCALVPLVGKPCLQKVDLLFEKENFIDYAKEIKSICN